MVRCTAEWQSRHPRHPRHLGGGGEGGGDGGGEGAKCWLYLFTELKNRGLDDVLMLVGDGLKGLSEGVGTVRPRTIIHTCVLHLPRSSFRRRPSGLRQGGEGPQARLHRAPRRSRRRSGSWTSRRRGERSNRRS
ncbi:transposase [Streptomyces mirabilis]|uniref:transposase n=1 Tax=Streptomyces mirabilis TaxID=68239 RepID=UPI0036B09BDC